MEINKCLEDPNTQYSDQYMPLAMMPAVVEAIQNAGGGGESHDTYYLIPTESYMITTPPTDAVTPPAGSTWEADSGFSFSFYLASDAEGTTPLTADQIKQVKIGDYAYYNNFDGYYEGCYIKCAVSAFLDINNIYTEDSYANAVCRHIVQFTTVTGGPSAISVGFSFNAEVSEDTAN